MSWFCLVIEFIYLRLCLISIIWLPINIIKYLSFCYVIIKQSRTRENGNDVPSSGSNAYDVYSQLFGEDEEVSAHVIFLTKTVKKWKSILYFIIWNVRKFVSQNFEWKKF